MQTGLILKFIWVVYTIWTLTKHISLKPFKENALEEVENEHKNKDDEYTGFEDL